MVIKNIQKFSEIEQIREEEALEGVCDEQIAMPEDIGDDRIVIEGSLFRLCGTDLIIAEGVYCNYDEDADEYEPDFSISLLYNAHGEPDLDSPLYWEQGTPQCMFHNYATMMQSLGDEAELLVEQFVA